MRQEIEDGYDTIEWAARLPWSNGRVGTTGQSYMGATQYMLSINNPLPPSLQVMAPVSASADYHESWIYHTGGVMEWGWMVPYAIHKGRNTLQRKGLEDLLTQMDEYVTQGDNFAMPLKPEWYRHLPINDWAERLKETAPYFADYLRNANDGSYWWDINVNKHLEHIRVPMFHVSSWYDIFLEGATHSFAGIREHSSSPHARRNQKLVIGPWGHLLPYNVPSSGGTGEADFGPEALIQLHDHLLRWFDHWLKDMDTGLMDEAPVRIFVMGEDRWRDEQEWPLARTNYTPFYLHSEGSANGLHGNGVLSTVPPSEEPADSYVYDPNDPAPTRGGNNLVIPMGVYDQRPVEERRDVLVYTSEPLERDTEVTGPLTVKLYASTSARDTDFTAKLVDVCEDGCARNLTDGIIRARYRESMSSPSLLEPGRAYCYTIDLWATSNVFKAGHQIRLEVSSSNFPRFDRNTNTGGVIASDTELKPAIQTILHDAAHPSHVTLPIVPR
jgi:putative CocE/NonD family hydrolase